MVCFLTGAVFLVLGRFVSLASRPSTPINKRSGVPLAEQFDLSSRSPSPSPILGSDEPLSPLRSRLWWKLGLLLSICCLRVELFRQVTLNSECVPAGYSVRLKFTLILNMLHVADGFLHTVCHSFHCIHLRLLAPSEITPKGRLWLLAPI